MGKLTLETCNGLFSAIWQGFYAIKHAGRKKLAEMQYDLTLEQLVVLSILDDGDGLNIGTLADLADKERTTMSRMVTGLEKRNLAVRIPDRIDHRQKLVYLTKTGRSRLKDLDTLGDEFEKRASAGLNPAKIKESVELLEKLAANLLGE
ncbi:MAG: MarR family transcriptional regulator [candidate division Zixibacteria bacterium]|nr:MarR family transcriptional regulator [candidate division Zixibacteria bacterium]